MSSIDPNPQALQPNQHRISAKETPSRGELDALQAIHAVGNSVCRLAAPLPIDVCPYTEEELVQNSILTQIDVSDFPELAPLVSETADEKDEIIRLTANMLGGGLLSGGKARTDQKAPSMDGWFPLPNYAAWDWLLRPTQTPGVRHGISQLLEFSQRTKALEDQVGNMAGLRELSLDLSNRIKNLTPGEFQLIYGGWSNRAGGSGHALVYEIRRAGNGTYDLYICTATGFQLTDTIHQGDKTRLKPIVHYRGVTENELLFNGDGIVRPAIIQSLIELKTLSSWDNNFVVDEEDILEIFDQFGTKRVKVNLERYGAITGQRSGSCVPFTTKCWIRKQCENIETYKHEMFQVKLRLLQLAYAKLRDEAELDTERGALSRRLLEQAARKLMRRTAKLRERPTQSGQVLVEDDLAVQANATAWDVITKMKAIDQKIESERQTVEVSSNILASDVDEERAERAILNFKVYQTAVGSSLIPSPLPPTPPALNLDGSNLNAFLDDITRCASYEYPIAYKTNYINAAIDQLPLPKIIGHQSVTGSAFWSDQVDSPFWNQINTALLEKSIRTLNDIALIYIANDYNQLATREYATLFAIHTLVHFLALKLDRQKNCPDPQRRLENYKTKYQGLETNNYKNLVYLDKTEFERIMQANSYFEAFNRQAKYGVLFENENQTQVIKDSVHQSLANGQFWRSLWNSDPELLGELDLQANIAFPDLTDDQINIHYQNELQNYRGWLAHNTAYLNRTSMFPPGPEPKQPEKKQNLPHDQKRTVILESQVNYSTANPTDPITILIRRGYKYITALSDISHRLNERILARASTIYSNRSAYRTSPYTTETIISKPGSTMDLVPRVQNAIDSFNPLNDEHRAFFELAECSRSVRNWNKSKAEVRALERKINDPFLKRLLRTLSQWKLTPHQLILEAGKNIDKMSCPSMQSLFFRLFLRSPVSSKGKASIGAGQLLLEDNALFENGRSFIQKGLGHYLQIQSKSGDQKALAIQGGKFFFELSFYLAKYLTDDGQYEKAAKLCQIEEINRWLALPDLDEKDRDILHQYRVLFYSNFDPQTLNSNQLSEIYQSWCHRRMNETQTASNSASQSSSSYMQTLLPNLDRSDPKSAKNVEALTSAFMAKLTVACKERLENEPQLRNDLGINILKFCAAHNCEGELQWEIDKSLGYPYLSLSISPTEFYQINLSKGEIYLSFNRLQGLPRNFFWENDADFRRIFKGPYHFEYRSIGNGEITFNHPEMGPIRLIAKLDPYSYFSIRRQFPGSDAWYEYRSTGTLQGIPEALKKDHSLWVPVEQQSWSRGFKGYLTSLKGQERKFVLDNGGLIIEVDAATGLLTQTSKAVDSIKEDDNTKQLTLFDKQMLRYTSQNGRLDFIRYPRYSSIEGNPLVFTQENGKFVWNDNREYYIPVVMPKGYLGTIPNYLYLKTDNIHEHDKLLVPFQSIKVSKVPFANGEIDIDARAIPDSEKNEEWGRHQYFSYSIEDGGLKPSSKEAELYLAYIHLSQKNYAHAIALLNKINGSVEKLSPISMQILRMIADLPKGEDHPELEMVQLHAHLQQVKELDRSSTKAIQSYFGNNDAEIQALLKLILSVQNCCQSLNNISKSCRMSDEDEILLISKLIAEGREKKELIKELLSGDKEEVFQSIIIHLIERRALLARHRAEGPIREINNGSRKHLPSTHGRKREGFNINTNGMTPFHAPQRGSYVNETSYNTALMCYQNDIQLKTLWLRNGEIPHLYTRPYRHVNYTPNGKLFMHVCNIAKNGTEAARQELLYQLKMHRLHSYLHSYFYGSSLTLDVMIMMLARPTGFPHPINVDTTSTEEQAEFLRRTFREYNTLLNNYTQSFFYPPNAILNDRHPPGVRQYPFPSKSAFDENKRVVEDIAPNKLDIDIELQTEDTRWTELANWGPLLEEDNTPPKGQDVNFKLHYDDRMLSENEKDCAETFERDLARLREDFNNGKAINLRAVQVSITNERCQQLHDGVSEKIEDIASQLRVKESSLLQKFNKQPADIALHLNQQSKLGGGAAERLSYEDSLACLLSMDRREYLLRNPQLTEVEVNELANLALEIVDLKSYLAQLKRIKTLTEKIYVCTPTDPTRKHFSQELHAAIHAQYHFENFDAETQLALRIFSGETGLIPHKKQTDLIKKMMKLDEEDPSKFKDIVIQLIMGGGKTSVLATILMYLSAKKPGRLGLFIIPASLYDTVKINLSTSFHTAFHKNLLAVDIIREDMTEYKLQNLIDSIAESKEHCQPIVIKASTIQALELEAISQARTLRKLCLERKKSADKFDNVLKQIRDTQRDLNRLRHDARRYAEATDKLKTLENRRVILVDYIKGLDDSVRTTESKLQLLCQIVKELPECADALIDEVDLALDALQQVNFPEGEKISISPQRNSLLHHIFKTMVRKDLKIGTLGKKPSIDEVIRLRTNEQSKMDKETFLNHVVPVIAEEVAEGFELIQDEIIDYKRPFIKYVSGKTPIFLQQFIIDKSRRFSEKELNALEPKWKDYGTYKELQEDLQFLLHLDEIYTQGDAERKEAVNLIALTRHVLVELLPATLSKSGRRDYGIKPRSEGKIIPYLAVHTPAKTEFGYHWEEACYYYQWAAAFAPDEKQIRAMVKSFEEMAQYYVQKNGENFKETVEYETFFKLFGVPLDKINEPGAIEEAIQAIGNNIEKKLDLQYENVAKNVSYNSERLTSNGVNLMSQLASRRAMSGTPWNVEGYLRTLAQRFEADLGTEGRILHALATKEMEGKIHTAELSSVYNFLHSIFDGHPTPEKIRGIIETGGLFKAFQTNYDVAKEIMRFFTETGVNDEIEGVLFFHNDPGQDEPDTLYVWKKGATLPERIGGSSVDVLRAKGLNPKKYFTLYDERHTTGQDIQQVPDAINLITFDEGMLRRTFTQGIMRLRQFLSSQNVELVTTIETRKLLVREGKDYEDFVISAEKTQSLRKAPNMVLHFQQQIDDIPRKIALRKIFATIRAGTFNTEAICDVTGKYEPFIVTKMMDEPYLQFGRLKYKVSTKDFLRDSLHEQYNKLMPALQSDLQACANDQEYTKGIAEIDRMLKEFGEMDEHIATTECLPVSWEETPKDLGVQQEIEVHQLVQVRQQVQINYELESEIQLELQRYEMARVNGYRDEGKMPLEHFIEMLTDIKSPGPVHKSLQEQLLSYDYGFDDERIPYHYAFSQPIYGTDAYFHSCRNILPVFHSLQRPPKQILAVRTAQGMRWLLLSEKEAKYAKMHLKTLYARNDELARNVWLIQPDGSKLVTDDNEELFKLDDEGVSEGLLEINAFAGNADYIDQHASDTEDWLKRHADIKIRFLKLKVARDEQQNQILRRCQVLMQEDKEEAFNPNNHTIKARLEKEQKNQGNIVPESELAAKTLAPKRVKDLKAEWVPYLGIDPEKSDGLTVAALEKLRDTVVEQTHVSVSSNFSASSSSSSGPIVHDIREKARKFTEEQFSNLRPFHGPCITKDQIKWLTPDKIGYLDKPEQICDIDPDTGNITNYLLTREQVQGLVKKQQRLIPYINPEFYETFTERWQIEAVPPEHINKINPDYLGYLSKRQMKKVTREIFNNLRSGATSSSSSSHRTVTLPPEKYGWLPGNLIDLIPPNFLNYVQRDQIEEITEGETIRQLENLGNNVEDYEPGTWTRWIHPKMVPQIDFDTQLQYLTTRELITEVPVEQVRLLDNKTQVPLICEDQVKGLQEHQLPECPKTLIQFLEPEQIVFLRDEQYPFLRGERQIHSIIDPNKFAQLCPFTDHHEHFENQMQWIGEHQYHLIIEDQVHGLSDEQILAIANNLPDKWEEIRGGLTKKRIESFDNQRMIDLLSGPQIYAHLIEEQTRFLREQWQVRHCPDPLVSQLNNVQIQLIGENQVPHLRGVDQIRHMPVGLFPHLTAEESHHGARVNQMQWVRNDRLELVQANQVKGLAADQLLCIKNDYNERWDDLRYSITEEQADTFDTQEKFNMLDGDQIHEFAKEHQVVFLQEEWQVENCPDPLVKHLTVGPLNQVAMIKAEQVEFLEGQAQIQACPDPLVPRLTEDQVPHIKEEQVVFLEGKVQIQACPNPLVRHLSVEQVADIKAEQVASLVGVAQIQACPLALVPNLTSAQVVHISAAQVPYLQGQAQIQACPNPLVRHLIPELQVAFISEPQVPHLEGEEQIQDCPIDFIPFLTPEQVPHISPEQVQYLEGEGQVQAIGEREDYIQRLVKNQFAAMADQQYAHLSLNQISEFDRQSAMFFRITVQQLQAIQVIETIRKIPEDLVPNLVYDQFALLEEKDEALIQKLSRAQIKEITEKDKAIISKIAPAQVPALKDELLSKLQLKKAVLLKVPARKLQHLTINQIRVRNATGTRNQLKYRMAGLGKMLILPLWLLGEFIYDLALTIFAIFRALFKPNAVNCKKLTLSLKRTFVVSPAISSLAPLEIFHPAKYLQMESKLVASAA